MASRLNPYISFNDNARQAMEFYQEVFGGDLHVSTFGEFGAGDPSGRRQGHARAARDRRRLHADGVGHAGRHAATARAQHLGQPQRRRPDELRGYWEKLSEGGTVTMPLEKQMWGDEFGMCIDRFGIRWMVNIAPGR